jgi:hypothetical protein
VPKRARWHGAVPPKLLAVLQEELERSGPEGAVAVCAKRRRRWRALPREKSGWAIRRVSLRNRNPKAVPDAWEQAALQDFDRRLAAQEPASKLEKSEAHTGSWAERAALHPCAAHGQALP